MKYVYERMYMCMYMELPCDSTDSRNTVYSYEMLCQNNICSTTHNLKRKKQIKCLLTDEWTKKIHYLYTLEYYSAIRITNSCHFDSIESVMMIREMRHRKVKSSVM